MVQLSPFQQDEATNLQTTVATLTEKIKRAKVVSDVDVYDHSGPFKMISQENEPLASLVNVIRCSSITQEEVLAFLRPEHDLSRKEVNYRAMPQMTSETQNYVVSI